MWRRVRPWWRQVAPRRVPGRLREALAQWRGPARWLVGTSGRGLAVVARGLWDQRAVLVALLVRVAWWSALALFLRHTLALLDYGGPLLPSERQAGYTCGWLLCAFVVVFGEARHLRALGVLLGLLHGALALFVAGEIPG